MTQCDWGPASPPPQSPRRVRELDPHPRDRPASVRERTAASGCPKKEWRHPCHIFGSAAVSARRQRVGSGTARQSRPPWRGLGDIRASSARLAASATRVGTKASLLQARAREVLLTRSAWLRYSFLQLR